MDTPEPGTGGCALACYYLVPGVVRFYDTNSLGLV